MPISDTWQDWTTSAASNPPAGTSVPLMDDEIRNIKAEIIKNAVALSGDQTVAGIKTYSAIPVLPASNPTTANQAARKAYVDAYFAAGTSIPFYQATAPAGWTQNVAINDRVLRVFSGVGGGFGGNWTLSGMSVDGHALSIAEMPAHNHNLTGSSGATGGGVLIPGPWGNDGQWAQGGGQAHTHGLTNSSWRPAYIDVIICSKD